MRYDPTSGLYESQSRRYSPTLQRWISIDPMRYGAGDADLYRMEGNGPVDQTDPSGMIPKVYGNVMKHQGWTQEDFDLMVSLAQLQEIMENKWWFESVSGYDDRIYNNSTLRREELGQAILDELERFATEVAENIAESVISQAAGPLAGRAVSGLLKQGWKLWKAADGSYYIKRAGCILRITTGCFARGTPLLTPAGWKAIEDFVPGDEILTRDEDDPNAPVHAQVVEAVFHRHTSVLKVVVRGQEVVLTEEHPFFTFRQGWTPARQLVPGELILGLDNKWLEVEAVENTGRHEIVYNMTVRDSHTFFVGKPDWNFALWVHNAGPCPLGGAPKRIPASEKQAKYIAKQIERDLGKDARRAFHDAKEGGVGDRTLEELKADAQALYGEAGKEIPKWLR
jgi:RHS repeat-associated protein